MLEDMLKSVFRWLAIVAGLVVLLWLLRVPVTEPARFVTRWALVGSGFLSAAVIVACQKRDVEAKHMLYLVGAAVAMLLLTLYVFVHVLEFALGETLLMRGRAARYVFSANLLLAMSLGGLLGAVVRRAKKGNRSAHLTACLCRNCGVKFPAGDNRKLVLDPNYSALGLIGTVLADLRDFDRVVCPKCGHEFRVDGVKMFGIFPRRLYWVPFAMLATAMVALWFYLRSR